jgi:calcineurin-like phosphoesterase family protein
MTRYFTADLHFGHVNIIRYCGRPFPDVTAMNDGLVERWNETVTDDDEVWVLGDVAMGPILDSLRHVRRLTGTKHLVPGNHDRCWPGHGAKAEPWIDRYLDAGFSSIHGEIIELSMAGHTVRACHFPYHCDSLDEQRFNEHRPVDDGRVLLHGHVHTRWRIDGRQINVGCDVWDYRPVAEAELAPLVTQLEQ